jgi:hypothetical protein
MGVYVYIERTHIHTHIYIYTYTDGYGTLGDRSLRWESQNQRKERDKHPPTTHTPTCGKEENNARDGNGCVCICVFVCVCV